MQTLPCGMLQQNSTVAEQYDNTGIVKIPENPQQSNDGRTAAVGMYTYYRVPWGLYNVTAEKEGHVYYAVFVLGPNYATSAAGSGNFNGEIGTATHNIAIPDYAYMAPVHTDSNSDPNCDQQRQPQRQPQLQPQRPPRALRLCLHLPAYSV